MVKFYPSRKNIKNYLEDLRATIPDYQRGYSWEQDQVGDFINDLEDESHREETSEYFFGPIVAVDKNDNNPREQIIDGQQRLTTITIFLAVVRDLLAAISKGPVDKNSRTVVKIIEDYIGDTTDDSSLRLLQKGEGSNFFREEIQTPKDFKKVEDVKQKRDTRKKGTKPTQNIMAHAYNQILESIKSSQNSNERLEDTVMRLYNTLLNHFFVIEILTSDEVNAFQIFQTLNARGKDLTSADLIKSNFFGRARTQTEGTRLKDSWQLAQQNLQTEDLTDYIRYLWNSQHQFATKRNLYRKVLDEFKNDVSGILTFSYDIGKLSDEFAELNGVNPIDDSFTDQIGNKSVTIINELNALNFHAYYPMVLALFKIEATQKEFSTALSMIQRILLRNKIVGGGTNWLEKLFAQEASKIVQSRDIGDSIDYLNEHAITERLTDKKIQSAMESFDFSKDEKFAKALLRIIENTFNNSKERGDLLPTNSKIHLDHIMPQVPKDYSDWGCTSADDINFKNSLWQLGNLTLWYGPDNSSLKNSNFQMKKSGEPNRNNGYKDSLVMLTKDLTSYPEWNPTTINERGQKLINQIIQL
ncbi:DUF262 domain-containing protein [Lentilactobacillus kefiri]|uniref:DUF262 domain-containing protein n=2 Tax=Lentilactobacillus kefiri TaxID=33962 RepID=A0A8E1V091_LENKE|nr:DUF262 domain-containing protein [Lentilactobacillus kefiri]KRL73286.1 hypothetical protein FD08_GL002771 [Lentilactobacillus parakefiri DSM 10551]KRM50070.1 hypothetical protein FC95_GL002119 [Lentilactobacillus kefiri DSM 20587 = JCM 5818]MCJ2162352.1 DUF262 domain-containing HNH endonuclease family protein [Lentilactobacillus kefiri]MCP9369612.1 DUF262 domain-containing protein [Lentilactobacillus kefiri]MDH5108922.1 DUF262 domain-containing HNH endonuclease family protein [Lentilactobac